MNQEINNEHQMISSFVSQIQSIQKQKGKSRIFNNPLYSSTLLFYCSSVIQNLWSSPDLIHGSICETENHEEKVKKIQKQFTKNLSLMHLWYPYHSTLTHNTGSSSDSEYPTMHLHHAISICIHTFAHSETLALKSLSTSFHLMIFYSPLRLSWGVIPAHQS